MFTAGKWSVSGTAVTTATQQRLSYSYPLKYAVVLLAQCYANESGVHGAGLRFKRQVQVHGCSGIHEKQRGVFVVFDVVQLRQDQI